MDPLSITSSCLTLIGTITKTSIVVTGFVRDVRDARSDLDTVSRELLSLKTVLELLADDAADDTNKPFTESLRKQISGIVTNCSGVVEEIEQLLTNHENSKFGKAAYWTMGGGRSDMAKLRSSLEAHKSALEIALDMVAISITRDIKNDTQEIRNDTSAIKEDTTQILAEIARLQAQLPADASRNGSSGFMLQRYLEDLTNYAETVVDSTTQELGASPENYGPDYGFHQKSEDIAATNEPLPLVQTRPELERTFAPSRRVENIAKLQNSVQDLALTPEIRQSSSNLQNKGQMLFGYTAQEDGDVTVDIGDEVLILDDSLTWWRVRRLKNGQEGVIPGNYVRRKGLVIYDFEAQGNDEVTVVEEDEVLILDDSNDERWKVRRLINGKEGVVPSLCIETRIRSPKMKLPPPPRAYDTDQPSPPQEISQIKRWKTIKVLGYFKGNIVIDKPIPDRILDRVPHAEPPVRDEFTHSRYSAVNCDPEAFSTQRFVLRPLLFEKPRRTECLVFINVLSNADIAVARTLASVISNVADLNQIPYQGPHPWGRNSWKEIVVCLLGNPLTHPLTLRLLEDMGVYSRWESGGEPLSITMDDDDKTAYHGLPAMVRGRRVRAHLYEYTTQLTSLNTDFTPVSADKGITPLQTILCLDEDMAEDRVPERWIEAFIKALTPTFCMVVPAGKSIERNSIYKHWANREKLKASVFGYPMVYYKDDKDSLFQRLLRWDK